MQGSDPITTLVISALAGLVSVGVGECRTHLLFTKVGGHKTLDLQTAYEVARSARFEHGAAPRLSS